MRKSDLPALCSSGSSGAPSIEMSSSAIEMAKDIPAGRAGQPEDVANAVAFFAAEQSSYLTGQVLCVDGGMAM